MSTPPPQGQRVPLSKEKNPVALAVATAVRYNPLLKQRQGILSTNKEKTDFFRYKRFVRSIKSPEFQKKHAANAAKIPAIPDDINAINQVFILLIQNQLVIPVNKLKTQDAKKQGYKVDKKTPALEVTGKAVIQPDAYYAWNYTPPNPYMMLYSILAVIGIFTVILFPLWPFWMRKGVWYLSTGLLCLVGLFFVVAVIRLIIYLISLATMPRQFWLFPNMFEDCGVIESFQPLYAWEEPKSKGQHRSKKGKKHQEPTQSLDTNKEDVVESTADTKTTSAKKSETTTVQWKATIEEVE